MPKILLSISLLAVAATSAWTQATQPFTGCPGVSLALVRAGINANTSNPFYMYEVNTVTGAFTQLAGGPYKDPQDPSQNLQANAIGVNPQDGFVYGLSTEATVTTSRLLRLDKAYGTTNLGYLPSPASPLGQIGIINSAAGDMDAAGNYWYTGATFNLTTAQLTGLYLGRVANVKSLTSFNGGLPVSYFPVSITAGCASLLSLLAPGLDNGIKDISFNPASNSFFSYVTYKPVGAPNYTGQLIEIRPVAGSSPLRYEVVCLPVTNTHAAETAGSLLDNSGNIHVLLTDGTTGKINASGMYVYTGQYNPFNNNTGLPNPLRGDMASCGGAVNAPLPVRLSQFSVSTRNCQNTFRWTAESELSFDRYELEQSTDNVSFSTASVTTARRSGGTTHYSLTVPARAQSAFYRLKLVEDDGKHTYSRTLTAGGGCVEKAGLSVYPNPVLSTVNVGWQGLSAGARMELRVFNASGVVVSGTIHALPATSGSVRLDVKALPKGSYWLKAVDKNGNSYSQHFVKQ